MKRMATDLDETLFDMMTPFKKLLMKRHNARVLPQSGYQIETAPETTHEQQWDIFRTLYKAHELCDPLPGARSYLEWIHKLSGEPPLILTSRPHEYASETHAQIKALVGDLPYNLVITGVPASKKYTYGHLFDIIVDDRYETILHFAEHQNKQGILIKRPWNRNGHNLNWYIQNKIIEVNNVIEITPFLRLLIDRFSK